MKSVKITLLMLCFILPSLGYSDEGSTVILVEDTSDDALDLKEMVRQYKKNNGNSNSAPASDPQSPNLQPDLPQAEPPETEANKLTPKMKLPKLAPLGDFLDEKVVPPADQASEAQSSAATVPSLGSVPILIKDTPPAEPQVSSVPKPVRNVKKRFSWKDDSPGSRVEEVEDIQIRTPPRPARRLEPTVPVPPSTQEISEASGAIVDNSDSGLAASTAAQSRRRGPRLPFKIKADLFKTGIFSKRDKPPVSEASVSPITNSNSDIFVDTVNSPTGDNDVANPASEEPIAEARPISDQNSQPGENKKNLFQIGRKLF